MEKEFVPYEQALELKGLGFDKPCLIKDTEQGEDFAIYYEHENGRPTFSQSFKFFREKYNLICRVRVTSYGCTLDEQEFYCEITSKNGTASYEIFHTYEEAELDCLIKLIEITKSK